MKYWSALILLDINGSPSSNNLLISLPKSGFQSNLSYLIQHNSSPHHLPCRVPFPTTLSHIDYVHAFIAYIHVRTYTYIEQHHFSLNSLLRFVLLNILPFHQRMNVGHGQSQNNHLFLEQCHLFYDDSQCSPHHNILIALRKCIYNPYSMHAWCEASVKIYDKFICFLKASLTIAFTIYIGHNSIFNGEIHIIAFLCNDPIVYIKKDSIIYVIFL